MGGRASAPHPVPAGGRHGLRRPSTDDPATHPSAADQPTTNRRVAVGRAGHGYTVSALVTYGGHTYRCLQAHTSQVGWEPPNVPALWQLVG